MISVDNLLYQIDLRMNKLATNEHQQIPIENKILVINDSQDQLVLNKVGPNNVYKLGLDAFKKRYQDLQFLIENMEEHPLDITETDTRLHKWVANVENLTPKFMFYIDGYLLADKEECKDRVIYTNPDLAKHADITILLRDSNFKPSFEYQETFIDVASDELHVYTDGTFTPTKLYIAYLRYLKRVRKAGIEDFEGIPNADVDCELEPYLENELLNIVVARLAKYTENTEAANSAESEKQTNE